jgi:hypothetical protein
VNLHLRSPTARHVYAAPMLQMSRPTGVPSKDDLRSTALRYAHCRSSLTERPPIQHHVTLYMSAKHLIFTYHAPSSFIFVFSYRPRLCEFCNAESSWISEWAICQHKSVAVLMEGPPTPKTGRTLRTCNLQLEANHYRSSPRYL